MPPIDVTTGLVLNGTAVPVQQQTLYPVDPDGASDETAERLTMSLLGLKSTGT